jgi:hypothetical protein
MTNIKTYSELIKLPTFIERFRYLKLDGTVGQSTFGYDRWLNQMFYQSPEWKRLRREIILRDNACDLGIEGHDIYKYVVIHHMNPIYKQDLLERNEFCMNPEYLICVTDRTHKALHYGDESLLAIAPVERSRFDTCPWKRF